MSPKTGTMFDPDSFRHTHENILKAIGALFKMGIAMALRNVMPVLAALMVTVAFFAVGVFVFWPVLLVAPGLASYCNAFLFNRIFDKYGMTLE